MAREQSGDEELQQLLKSSTSGLQIRKVMIPDSFLKLWCDASTTTMRPYVTRNFWAQALETVHGLAHPGIRTTVKMVTERFVWTSVKKDCREWARACLDCQRNKISRYTMAPLGRFQLTSTRFEHVHKPSRIISHICRLQILSHRAESFHQVARGNTNWEHTDHDRGKSFSSQLDCTFWSARKDKNGSRQAIWVRTVCRAKYYFGIYAY